MTTNAGLPSWKDGVTKAAILDFVARVTNEGAKTFVPPEARIAVFDNDGTLWCEKPLPIQADFLLDKLGEQAAKDASLRDRQPWKAVWEKDYKWLSDAITKHYRPPAYGWGNGKARCLLLELRWCDQTVEPGGPSGRAHGARTTLLEAGWLSNKGAQS
jgi:hypothetical protein